MRADQTESSGGELEIERNYGSNASMTEHARTAAPAPLPAHHQDAAAPVRIDRRRAGRDRAAVCHVPEMGRHHQAADRLGSRPHALSRACVPHDDAGRPQPYPQPRRDAGRRRAGAAAAPGGGGGREPGGDLRRAGGRPGLGISRPARPACDRHHHAVLDLHSHHFRAALRARLLRLGRAFQRFAVPRQGQARLLGLRLFLLRGRHDVPGLGRGRDQSRDPAAGRGPWDIVVRLQHGHSGADGEYRVERG